jgi:hypothetical protein
MWPLSLQAKGSYMSLTLNLNVEMIKPSEEGMSKAKRGPKLGFLCLTAKLRSQLEGNLK